MIKPTVKQARSVLTILDKAQFTALVRVVLGLRKPPQWLEPLTVHQQLKMYVYEWLAHLRFVSDAQTERLLGKLDPALTAQAVWMEKTQAPIESLPSFTFTIFDRRYCVWQTAPTWYDLVEDEFTDNARSLVTFYGVNVVELFVQKQRWLLKLQGGKDAGHQHHDQQAGLVSEEVRQAEGDPKDPHE